MATVAEPKAETFADLWERLGNVPLERISIVPAPGTATREDVLRYANLGGRKHLFELVAGTLVEKPMGQKESRLAVWLGFFVGAYLRSNPLGSMTGSDGAHDTVEDQVRYPDFGFTLGERIFEAGAEDDAILRIAPDLAVEVLSPSNTRREMEIKLREYFEAGVRLVWIVDPPSRTVRVHTSPEDVRVLTEDDTLDGGEVLPGFTLSIREWFEQARVLG